MTDDPKPLSPRHARFVAEYLKDLNATQAYIRAGYKPRSAHVSACKLLKQPQIEAAVAEGQKRIALSLTITVEQIAAEYSKIARANVDDFLTEDANGRTRIDLAKADRAKRAGLIELTTGGDGRIVKLKLGKLQALAMLMKHVGVLVTKPAPGLTPEDRKRLEAEVAAARRSEKHDYEQRQKLQVELHKMREALVAAEQKFAQIGVMPPAEVLAASPTDQRVPGAARMEAGLKAAAGEAAPPEASEPSGGLRKVLRRELRETEPSPAPQGIPERDSPEFRDVLGKLRMGKLDYAMTRRMIEAGYGPEPEPEPDMTYQMECDYEPNWG